MNKKISYAFFCLVAILLIGCQAGGKNTQPDARAALTISRDDRVDTADNATQPPENKGAGVYWDGGEWGDQPVVSLEHGSSLAARAKVVSCGLRLEALDTAVENHLNRGVPQSEGSKIIISELDESGEPLWSRSITVNSLTSDTFLINCREESP